MLKHHHSLFNFMSRMRRSYNSKQVNLQKLILSRLHQTRTNKLGELTYVHKIGGTIARTSGTKERTSNTKEKAGGTEERTVGPKVIKNTGERWKIWHLFRVHRTGGTKERSGSTETRTGGTIEKIGGTKDYSRKLNSPIPKLSYQEVDPLIRVRRDLNHLSQSGTDEGTGGTNKRTGGTEERNGGTEERTGSTKDSYKQWRKMG